jgi:NAD(P)-dependent dehydrogenase (short-subunit alcohol dehydrogenase family)
MWHNFINFELRIINKTHLKTTIMNRLAGNVTIITGGGKGICFGLAEAFAEEGSNLVITGRTESRLLAAKEKLESKYGVEVLPIVADGADEEAIKRVVAAAVEKFGKITTLVNNAQVSKSGVPLVEHSKEDFDLAIYSGLYAAFFYMRECYPYLKESRGSVINFASGAGLFGKLGQSSYAAAKEGIRGMSRVAAAEWGPDGVRVNVVCPLAMTESLQQWKENYPDLFQKTIQGIPLGRFADPKQDIGRVCVFLASDDASYVTGETITLQGGSGLRP